MTYTDLIFDLYGTLADIRTEEDHLVWDKTALYFGYYGARYTGEELRAAFRAETARREGQAGQSYECFPDLPFEETMATLFRAAGVEERAEELGFHAAQLFRVASTEYIRLYPGVIGALGSLRARGFRLWLLTNAQRAFTAFELRHLGLDGLFDGIYISSDHRCRKPDRRFFAALLEERGLDPARCLMIGNDRETDIAGAGAVGLSTLYMHTNLTPAHQAPADPALAPAPGLRRMEYGGWDWPGLAERLCLL